MNYEEQRRLEAAGWKETTVSEFLGLTPEEEALIEEDLAARRQQVAQDETKPPHFPAEHSH